MSTHIRAFDKSTGKFVGFQIASEKTDGTRYSHDYRCPDEECSCGFHWRRAVRPHQNTEYRPATFVKNPSSSHRKGCSFDYSAFAKRYHEQVYYDGDMLNFRVQFPLGAAPSDLYPDNYLTDQQKRAARNKVEKRGFKSLRELVDFIENKKHGLESIDMSDVNLLYQGKKYSWSDIFTESDRYEKLLNTSNDNLLLTVVKPLEKTSTNHKGKWRFSCRAQRVISNGTSLLVRPILVLGEEDMLNHFENVIRRNGTVLVSSRVFHGSAYKKSERNVFLSVARIGQLAQIDTSKYWRTDKDQSRMNFSVNYPRTI